MLDHRGWVRCTGDAQRSTEGPPPQRCREATLIGVQPGTPARVRACCINGDGNWTVPRRHGHHSEQFDGQLSLPAADARSHRRGACVSGQTLALDHRSVYVTAGRPKTKVLLTAGARPTQLASGVSGAAASLRMSMRHPVSRAANRAFWPSLPIASDSWKSGTITRAARAAASTT